MAAIESEQMPQIAWREAEVDDGELHVALSSVAPHGWAARYREVLARLAPDGEDRWGRVSVSRREIRVADVAEGGEGDLQYLLESVLVQVNADLSPEEEPAAEPSPAQQRDARLTEAFRGFAP